MNKLFKINDWRCGNRLTLCDWLLFETHKNLNIDTLLFVDVSLVYWIVQKLTLTNYEGFFFAESRWFALWYSWDWCNCGINDIVHYIMGTWSHSTVKLHPYTYQQIQKYMNCIQRNINKIANRTNKTTLNLFKKNKKRNVEKKTHKNLIFIT